MDKLPSEKGSHVHSHDNENGKVSRAKELRKRVESIQESVGRNKIEIELVGKVMYTNLKDLYNDKA